MSSYTHVVRGDIILSDILQLFLSRRDIAFSLYGPKRVGFPRGCRFSA